MPLDLNTVRAVPDLLENGVWWNFETKSRCADNKPHVSDACLLIAYGGFRFNAAIDRVRGENILEIRAGKLSEKKLKQMTAQAMLVILRGWVNITVNGLPFEYSEENALEILTNDEWSFIRSFITHVCDMQEEYLKREFAESVGNSKPD